MIDTDLPLDTMFPNKFKRIERAPEKADSEDPVESSKEKEKAPEKAPEGDEEVSLGEDVTRHFPLAFEEGFKVFRRGSYFHVYEGDETTPMNDKGLRREKVKPFLRKYLED